MVNKKNKLEQLEEQIDNLQSTKSLIEKIVANKEKLLKMSKGSISDNQKFWLLALEASENRISSSSKDQIVEDMFLLLKFIE